MKSRHLADAPVSPPRPAARTLDPSATRRRIASAAILGAAVALAFAAARDAHGTTYKWIDARGVVHYSDKMTVDALNRGHVELNKQGLPVRKIDAPLTADQIRAREAEILRQRQAAKANAETDRRDTALIATYSREEDIDFARSRALTTIDSQLQSARVYAAQLTKRQHELVARKASYGGKSVPPAVERELESIDSELAKTNALIEAKRRESLATAAKYDADKARYRELRESGVANGGPGTSAQVGRGGVNVVPTSAVR
jgi:hypothetical protein